MLSHRRRSILCPHCSKLVSQDEPSCPHCGTSRPGAWWKNNAITRGLLSSDRVIKTLTYTNVGLYIISLVLNPSALHLSSNPFKFLSPSSETLILLGTTGTIPIDQWHRWWTLVSANYLHGGILHILFNMLALSQIGPLVVREYGVNRMISIYTLGGVFGFLLSYFAGVRFTLGASAAVCSLIGASLYYGKSRGGTYGHAIYKQVSGWVLGLLLFGFIVPGINNWGHGGGIVAGIALGFLLGYRERTPETLFHKLLGGGCVVLTIVVLLWATVSSLFYRLLG
ncbi:MAG: rhomboid family intramembrane serine protease [Deltaproteobacteria bacterium]|nr:MAG: rhomboid family intramembrane serine protease [Deltaproteobacteria bacterium]